MKFTVVLLAILLNTVLANAWQAHSQVIVGPNGQLQDSVTLYCRPDELLCLRTCGNSEACIKEQELCYNCLGTANPILKVVFTEIDRLFRITPRPLGFSETSNVFRADHIFVTAKSIYNFYTPVDSEAILMRFKYLCNTNDTPEPIVVLGKNAYNEPNQIKYVICNGTGPMNQDMHVLEYNPQVIKSSINTLNVNNP